MTWLEFVASLVDALAWPVVVLILVVVLRTPLSKLINDLRLSKLKIQEFEAELSERIEAAKEDFSRESAPEGEYESVDIAFQEIDRLMETRPDFAVFEAWKILEGKLHELGRSQGVAGPMPPRRLVERLVEMGLLSRPIRDGIFELLAVRNKIAHEREFRIDRGLAEDFVNQAATAAGFLMGVKDSLASAENSTE